MEKFLPSQFFDLSNFAHAEIFDGCQNVWEVLDKIKPYLSRKMLGKIDSAKQEYAYFVNPDLISIGEGTVIEPGVYIKGPCIIGDNCHIRHGAYIRGDVIIGNGCVIGHATELKHVIMLNHSNAAHFDYLGDSVVGSYVNLGAGTKCANLRLSGDEIVVHNKSENVHTGMRKFGAVIGDHVQVGCNVVLNPGSVIGKYVHVYPSLNFGGVIAEKSIVKPSSRVEIVPHQ